MFFLLEKRTRIKKPNMNSALFLRFTSKVSRIIFKANSAI